jgi:hypothetical protein
MQLELVGGVKTKQDEGVYVQTATCYIVGGDDPRRSNEPSSASARVDLQRPSSCLVVQVAWRC